MQKHDDHDDWYPKAIDNYYMTTTRCINGDDDDDVNNMNKIREQTLQ